MNRKGLAILMRTRMRPTKNTPTKPVPSSASNEMDRGLAKCDEIQFDDHIKHLALEKGSITNAHKFNDPCKEEREFELVRESMHSAISMNKTEVLDTVLNDFSKGYYTLSHEKRQKLLLILAREYDLDRMQVRDLIQQYLGLELPTADKAQSSNTLEESLLSSLYRTERNLRHALKPMYEVLFERLNTHPGGLKFLSTLRADILCILS